MSRLPTHYPQPAISNLRRILIIKPSAIGDVVHTLPILNLLRKRWPDAHISWLVTPACAGLLEGHPQLDEVILFERRRYGSSWRDPGALRDLFALTRKLRKQQFDLVIDLQGLFRSGWLTWKTRAPVRIGFANAREGAPIAYTHRVPVASADQHAIDRYLSITEALGCGRGPVEFHFATGQLEREYIADQLRGVERYAVLLPGTNWQTKRWPEQNFAALVGPLKERFGLTSVIAGGSDVAPLAAKIGEGAISLVGKTNLRELTALLEASDLVIANDSGPMHIAAALGKPLVALFGPTNPLRTGPYQRPNAVLRLDIPCSPCYSRTCGHQSCLRWMTVDAVLDHAAGQLNSDMRRSSPLTVVSR
jgi:lipopolysaccharide heptosyltransferase I